MREHRSDLGIDRRDPVLALLPADDDLPRSFIGLPAADQAWRGRLFAVSWILYCSEAYAWALALASDEDGATRRAIDEVADAQILSDLALCPFTR